MQDAVRELVDRGLKIPAPSTVYVAPEVACDRIADDVSLHPGCRILGGDTSIGPGSELGAEGPVVLDNCQLGAGVSLKGGFFSHAVFLDGVQMGSCAQVRSGTLMEEEASAAHGVGFKQTILMPFVTAGSLINLCDCIMAGGVDRSHHSEIGSCYVHFNFTPQGDKATASLIGDVPRGVMLDQAPVFLGGQGGLVGPVQVEYGTVLAAGSVHRHDITTPNHLVMSPPNQQMDQPYDMTVYPRMEQRVIKNLVYIGNLLALKTWYLHVRKPFMSGDRFGQACYEGALEALGRVIAERIQRLGQLATKAERSLGGLRAGDAAADDIVAHETLLESWPAMEAQLAELEDGIPGAAPPAPLAEALGSSDQGYIETIRALGEDVRCSGTAWLQDLVNASAALWQGKS
jgi:UDP-N-acetylglucosamine/UDP-N-acetylgalactosamine diphosphorylase